MENYDAEATELERLSSAAVASGGGTIMSAPQLRQGAAADCRIR
jgi:hypothetical protein